MIVETAVESYRFTCARCAARWTASYEVRQVTDDGGAIDSLYRFRGAPCEAPIGGNVACPACRCTQVRKDPLYVTPVAEVETVAEVGTVAVVETAAVLQVPAASVIPRQRSVTSRQRSAWGTWHRFKFQASVTMDAGPAPHGRQEYPSGVPGLFVRAPSWQRPSVRQYFPALFFTDEKRPLRLGDRHVRSIVCVPDDDAAGFFQAGQHFTVWDGVDVGHGIVAQRIVFGWPEVA